MPRHLQGKAQLPLAGGCFSKGHRLALVALLPVLEARPGASTEGFVELRPNGAGVLLVSELTTRVQLLKILAAPLESVIETQLVEWILGVQTRVLRESLP